MKIASTCVTKAARLSELTVATVFLWCLGTNTHLDTTPRLSAKADLPQAQAGLDILADDDTGISLLSPADAALYRAAFVDQEQGDNAGSDLALGHIKDKRLTGHVLAARYARQGLTLDQARGWMSAYADLPEARDIYDQARKMKGFQTAHLVPPIAVTSWSGNETDIGSFAGFRDQNEGDAPKDRIYARINNELRHDNGLKARELLITAEQRGAFTGKQSAEVASRIASSLFYDGEVERARPLAHRAASEGVPLGLWIEGLAAWKQQDYQGADRSFASLAQAPGLGAWDRAAAAYWAYRAAKKVGDETQARHWLAEAAKAPHSFYGLMAASLSGHTVSRSWKMPELTEKNIDTLSHLPAGWQALALTQIRRPDLAEDELRRLNPTGRHDLQIAALALAEKAHMPSLSLQLASLATNDNGQPYEAALFPIPSWQPSNGFKVDRALIYALMKHESHFDPDAVSQSGACGLMQLMPSTARNLSDESSTARTARDCPDRLFDPTTNLDMGQKYVRVLAGQPNIGDNLMLLLAAYNGGPGNLAHWLDASDRKDPLLFMESLPLRETRDYVQQVLMQYWMYRSRMGEGENSVVQLARGEWPRYALRDDRRQGATKAPLELASAENRAR